MFDGLNDHAEPRPAWERTLERIEFYTTDLPQYRLTGTSRLLAETDTVYEIAFRVIGTELPMKVGNAKVPQKFVDALKRMKRKTVFPDNKTVIDRAINWIKRTYP
jgi:hypothetical protein